MKLEHQVVSLELAKKLKELGVKQESYFWWDCVNAPSVVIKSKYEHPVSQALSVNPHWLERDLYSAFTVAELGEILPDEIHDEEYGYLSLCSYRFNNEWVFDYQDDDQYPTHQMTAYTEANARAKMLIYLLENKLIKP